VKYLAHFVLPETKAVLLIPVETGRADYIEVDCELTELAKKLGLVFSYLEEVELKTMIIALAVAIAGCATPPQAKMPVANNECGRFDTDKLRYDLAHPYRTDREWYEAVINRMAWYLDCEQGKSPNAGVTGLAPKKGDK